MIESENREKKEKKKKKKEKKMKKKKKKTSRLELLSSLYGQEKSLIPLLKIKKRLNSFLMVTGTSGS